MPQDNPCSNVQAIKKWIEEDKGEEENCRSCQLGLLGNWYISELKEQGRKEIAQEIENTPDNSNYQEFAQKLDEVKEKVDEKLRMRLKEFDCTIQKFVEGG